MNNPKKDNALLAVGKVTGVHGLKGYLKVTSYAESASIFSPGTRVYIDTRDGQGRWQEISRSAPHKKGLLLSFTNVDVNEAQTLLGADLLIDRDSLPELDEDTYYWEDLIGLDVIDETAGMIGTIRSVIATGSNDVFVVAGKEREIMVPALASVVLEVNLESNVMRIDLPEGL